MNFEDRLRASMKSAGEATPGRPLEWDDTLNRARRSRRNYVAAMTVVAAAVAVAAATASVVALTGGAGPDRGIPPAGPDATESPEPKETTTRGPSETPSPPEETPTPGPDESPPPEPACSAEGMSPVPVQQDGLAPEVAETRRRILELAVACDYEGLEALADDGREFFSYSIGETESVSGNAARYWRQAEKGGEPVMRSLVIVMNIDYKIAEGFDDIDRIFAWPSASYDPTEEDWQKVVDSGLMTSEEVQGMKEVGYIGWRTQIASDGDWFSFVAGD
jgi:hypothetical protein